MSANRPPTRLRFKFALLGAVGGALVLLPLGQVLRYQSAQLIGLSSERAALDPMANALALQRGLLHHDVAATRVLQGRTQLEGERRLRQAQVDEQLWLLQGTLSAGYWIRALGENTSLAQDWRHLASRIVQRQISANDSHAGHQLLVEQAVQIMDLVSVAAPAASYARLVALQSPTQVDAARAAGPAALLARLDALQVNLNARSLELQMQQTELRSQQAAVLTALVALLATALAAVLWARRSGADAGGPPAGDGVRRGNGRRAADVPAPARLSGHLLARLRGAASATAMEPPATQPPRA
jgi:hypothetical protein